MELKGKQLSLWAKIIAIVFLLVCFAVSIFTGVVVPINDAIKVSLFVALLCCSPVDVSFWLEKMFGKKDTGTAVSQTTVQTTTAAAAQPTAVRQQEVLNDIESIR